MLAIKTSTYFLKKCAIIVSSIFFIAVSFRASAQHFFIDSIAAADLSPIPQNIVKANSIKKILVYVSDNSGKDSALDKVCIYDTTGSLIKSIAYHKGRKLLQDTFIYDANHRIQSCLSGNFINPFSKTFYTYLGDSIVLAETYTQIPTDTGYDKHYCYYSHGSLTKVVSSSTRFHKKTTHYESINFYDNDGQLSKVVTTSNNSKPDVVFYDYSDSKGKKKIIVSHQLHGKDKAKTAELHYNNKNQCISYQSFFRESTTIKTFPEDFIYDTSGLLYKHIRYVRLDGTLKITTYTYVYLTQE
jgi:hypothetical protein